MIQHQLTEDNNEQNLKNIKIHLTQKKSLNDLISINFNQIFNTIFKISNVFIQVLNNIFEKLRLKKLRICS
jgi:hypothetical protein